MMKRHAINKHSEKGLTIALEVFPLSDNTLTGVGVVAKKLVETLQRVDVKNRYVLYFKVDNRHVDFENPRWKGFSPGYGALVELKNKIRSRLRGRGPLALWPGYVCVWFACKLIHIGYCNIVIPLHLMMNRADVYIGTSVGMLPPFLWGKRLKKGLFIYDLVWVLFPGTMRTRTRYKLKTFGMRNLARTDFLLSISDSTRRDFGKMARYSGAMYTVHLAADRELFYAAPAHEIARVRREYGIHNDYILAVGTLEPRKNLKTLLSAFSILGLSSVRLVLVGMTGWGEGISNVIDEYGIRDRVVFTGYVPTEDLAPLYSGASVFVFPSLYEGFGLPVIEAMQCGCPVIAADNSSLPEVAGGAALLFNAEDADELAAAIDRVLRDSRLRKELKRKGLIRAREFSWEKSAGCVLDIISNITKI